MKETDIEELKKWMLEHGYYVGSSGVAETLRKLAEYYDD